MKKEILQRIKNLAKFVFDEGVNFNKLLALIVSNEFTAARLFLDNHLEEIESLLDLTENDEDILNRYKQCDELIDIVIDLIINREDAYGKGRQVAVTA